MAIILPDSANSILLFSAEELKKHIKLIFDEDIDIVPIKNKDQYKKYIFLGIRPRQFSRELKPEEAVYVIGKTSIYIFGNDEINRTYSDESPGDFINKITSEALDLEYNRPGTLFAVYTFLENEAGFTWIKPGDDGIFFTKTSSLELPVKEVSWNPQLIQRNIRAGTFTYRSQLMYGQYAPKEFNLSEEESLNKLQDLLIWMRRMRLGRNENYRFSHAFNSYWEKYKDTKPDIFAFTVKGNRKAMGRIERVKMCPSNPDLPKIIVEEWKNNLQKFPHQKSKSISGCENDSDGLGSDDWCHCDACNALDAREPGEDLYDYVTDRYVYLWNAILKEARKYQDDIMVTGYAYENMLQPPRKEKLEDGLLIEFIPRMGGDYDITEKLYEGWENAGMKKMMFRPNDMNWEIGIPMGQEERIFNNFKLAIRHNAIGTDFDSMLGFWEGISDLTYYTLAKGQVDPQVSFEKLEDEFLTVFGEARENISQYYRHWRNIFNNKILKEELRLNDGINTYFLEWARLYRLTGRIDEFYSMGDFDTTDSYLDKALQKNISEQARNYIQRMQIANQHSRLTFSSFMAGKGGNRADMVKKANDLISFRIQNKNKIDIHWNLLFQYQHYHMKDQIGTRYLGFLPKELDTSEF